MHFPLFVSQLGHAKLQLDYKTFEILQKPRTNRWFKLGAMDVKVYDCVSYFSFYVLQ